MINSDDIEVAELGCNLFLKEKDTTFHQLNEIITKSGKYFIFSISNHQVQLITRFDFGNNSIFLKDPTRTILIDLE